MIRFISTLVAYKSRSRRMLQQRRHQVIVLLLIVVLTVGVYIWKNKRHEPFSDTPLLIYKTEQSRRKITLDIDPAMPTSCIQAKVRNLDWLEVSTAGSSTSDLYASDVYTYKTIAAARSPAVAVVLGCMRYFYIARNSDYKDAAANTLKQVIDQKLPIYVPNQTQRNLLYALVTATGFNPSTDLVLADSPDKAAVQTRFDYLVAPKKRQPDSILSFDTDLNIHKLKSQIPFVQTEAVDMSIYFDTGDDKFPVKSTLAFKSIIWQRGAGPIKESAWIRQLIDTVGDTDDTSYYTMHFNFISPALQALKDINRLVMVRDKLPILEQFSGSDGTGRVIIEPKANVAGYYDASAKTLVLEKPYIDGVPLEIATRVVLTKQDRPEENGIYEYKAPWLVKLGDIKSAEPPATKPQEFICFGDDSIKIKGLCESPFDAMGRAKVGPRTVWDRPCVVNTECPFYQANKTYPNYRGGCNNGYCEMPLGIERLGFRQYDKAGARPICHGCPLDTPYCCDEQTQPDYAFELDGREL